MEICICLQINHGGRHGQPQYRYEISNVNVNMYFACRLTMVGGMDIEQGGLSAEQGQKTQSGYSVIQVRLISI